MKKIMILLASFVILGAGCSSVDVPKNKPTTTDVGTSTTTNGSNTTVTSTTTTTTKDPNSNGGTEKTFSMDEIKSANTPEKCWTVIRGTVYNLTAWIEKHPGGDRSILSICGIDGTTKFVGKHGGQAGPEKALAGFEMGKLK